MTDSEKKEWQKYIDNAISHAIGAVEYGNYFYDEIKALADEAKDDCQAILDKYVRCGTKARCTLLEKQIDTRLKELENDIAAFIEFELPKIIEEENNFLKKNVEPLIKLQLEDSAKAMKRLAIIPIATAGAAIGFGTLIANKLKSIYNSEITQGFITGSSFEDLEDDYESSFNFFDRGLQADAETLGSSLGDQYERMVFTKNKDKVKRVMWTAILDSSTCLSCGSLDGQVFDDITAVPIYPLHDRCRCRLIPVPDFVDDEEVKLSYTEWFERQSDKEKYKILGKTRYTLYKDGMKIKQFVNNGRKIPLSELNTKNK